MKMFIKRNTAFKSLYIALIAIIVFSLLIFYLPITASAVNLSIDGVRSDIASADIESWIAQFDFYPPDHPYFADNGILGDFLPYW
jgi:hypothetical protein